MVGLGHLFYPIWVVLGVARGLGHPHIGVDVAPAPDDGRTVFSKQISQTVVRGYLSPSSDGEAGSAEGVTERELDVLQLLIVGAPNTEMAERLHISVGTVQFHLTNIYGKLGVRSRGEAVIKAAREGMIVIDE